MNSVLIIAWFLDVVRDLFTLSSDLVDVTKGRNGKLKFGWTRCHLAKWFRAVVKMDLSCPWGISADGSGTCASPTNHTFFPFFPSHPFCTKKIASRSFLYRVWKVLPWPGYPMFAYTTSRCFCCAKQVLLGEHGQFLLESYLGGVHFFLLLCPKLVMLCWPGLSIGLKSKLRWMLPSVFFSIRWSAPRALTFL